MTQSIVLSGLGGEAHRAMLDRTLRRIRPRAIALVSAFVSVDGMKELLRIARGAGNPACRLVAGTDYAVTHPRALTLAVDSGWQVRLGRARDGRGIFHPKLLIAGSNFGAGGGVNGTRCIYVGSSNMTAGGLEWNVECGPRAVSVRRPRSSRTSGRLRGLRPGMRFDTTPPTLPTVRGRGPRRS